MRVLQINSVCGVGSTGRIATDIHDELLKQGHESYIAYGRGEAKNIDPKYTIKIGNKFDLIMHGIKSRLFDRHGFGSKTATKKFVKQIEDLNPDIIHLHNIHGYYINIEILFKYLKKAGKKVVWTLHDCWSFTGHSAFFDYPKIEGWDNGIHNCQGKDRYPKSYFLDQRKKNGNDKKRIFNGVDDLTIITPSIWLKDLVTKSFLNEYNVEVINNGINLDVFKPTKNDFRLKYNLEMKRIYLGVANVWDERKGLDFFIEMSKQLNNNEVIVLVGVTKKQKLRLPMNIIGISRTNSINELAEVYSAADVFINPTKEDNYPTVNLEAQACKTVVVTANVGGCKETLFTSNSFAKEFSNILEVLELIRKVKKETNFSFDKFKIDKQHAAISYKQLYSYKEAFHEKN